MPTYTYECGKCGHNFDVFHGMSATPELKCEECGSKKLQKLIGTGGGIIFKGGGFYETDYKTKVGTAPAKEAKDSSSSTEKKESSGGEAKEPAAKSESKSDTKADTKSETKTPAKAPAKSEK